MVNTWDWFKDGTVSGSALQFSVTSSGTTHRLRLWAMEHLTNTICCLLVFPVTFSHYFFFSFYQQKHSAVWWRNTTTISHQTIQHDPSPLTGNDQWGLLQKDELEPGFDYVMYFIPVVQALLKVGVNGRQQVDLDYLTPPQARTESTAAGILIDLISLIAFLKLLQQAALIPILMKPGQVNSLCLQRRWAQVEINLSL